MPCTLSGRFQPDGLFFSLSASAQYPRSLLSRTEFSAVAPLAFAVSLRMLGLFLLLPVLAPYVLALPGGSWLLAGLAVGAYGATQAVFLIPLGWLSDLVGRKPVIVGALVVFAAGGFIAGAADSPAALIAGRAIQGAGAISAAALAAVSDATSDRSRTLGMAIVGIGIAVSFGLAIVLGGTLASVLGVGDLLAATGWLGLIAAAAVACAKLAPLPQRTQRDPVARLPRGVLLPCSGVFAIHAALAAVFVFIPPLIAKHLAFGEVWRVYLPAFAAAVVLAAPVLMRGKNNLRVAAAAMLLFALAAPAATALADSSLIVLGVCLVFFLASFCVLEALLPALASRMAVPSARGLAMGAFAVCQASGAFLGAALAGVTGHSPSYKIILLAAGTAAFAVWIWTAARSGRN